MRLLPSSAGAMLTFSPLLASKWQLTASGDRILLNYKQPDSDSDFMLKVAAS
jgi:hypothetical protein